MRMVCLLLCAAPSMAMPLTLVAEVQRDDAPDDRTADISLVIATNDGSAADVSCFSRDAPLQGTLVVECDIPDAMANAELIASLSLDGELVWSDAVPSPARVAVANRANSTRSADDAASIAGGNLIQRTSVTGGAVGFAAANVVGVPADIADGVDQGNVTTVQAPLSLSNGTLVVGVLAGTAIAAGSITAPKWTPVTITAAQIRATTFDGSDLSELVNADFANNTLSRANDFAAGQFVVGVRQQNVGCSSLSLPPLTTAAMCPQIRDSCPVGQLRACNTGTCAVDNQVSNCTNTTPGQLLIP